MAEKIRAIELKLNSYKHALENHYITQKEYNELTQALGFELHILAEKI